MTKAEGKLQRFIEKNKIDLYGFESRWEGKDFALRPEDMKKVVEEARTAFPIKHASNEVLDWLEEYFGKC